MKLIIFICLLELMVALIEASTERTRCKDVACPAPEICPEDSYLKLTKHHSNHFHHHLNSNVKDSTRKKRALAYGGRQRETIKIIPGAYVHHNRKRSITNDEMLILQCCPQYECACIPNNCDQECPANKIPANTTNPTEQFGVPGNCCVPCKDNYCIHDKKYRKHGDRWLSDDCTDCKCEYGLVSCQTPSCKMPNCLNYKQIPGECCPVCDDDGMTFCAGVGYCSIHCKYGYQRQGDCDLCQCARPPTNGSIHTTVAYPEVESTTGKSTESVADVEDIVRKGPHQNNSYGFIINTFWIYLMSCVFALILIIGIIGWYCYCRNNAKYDAVQV
ncbi:cysteine-rich motor neuron 1 protein-like isoform X1 [Armigeres subalbatus]|uniref:cysteine-rich motor neuron 1 protein-like isoform X1 n=1 Tax=Armigeres subalbatus TaxID=124917 RepID=UPI002ED47111